MQLELILVLHVFTPWQWCFIYLLYCHWQYSFRQFVRHGCYHYSTCICNFKLKFTPVMLFIRVVARKRWYLLLFCRVVITLESTFCKACNLCIELFFSASFALNVCILSSKARKSIEIHLVTKSRLRHKIFKPV